MKNTAKNLVGCLILIAISFGLGAIFGDFWLGPLTMIFGSLSAYYMSVGKWQNYIFGLLFNVLYAYSCFLSGLFGYAIFAILIYLPTNIWGLLNWFRHKTEESVQMKSMKFPSACLLVLTVLAASVLVGWLLSMIPSQNLAFLDSTSQVINLGGLILLSLRFREGWYVYLANNTVDLAIWIVNTIKKTASAPMMLIVSVMYLVMNLYGIYKWIKLERTQNLLQLGD